MEATEVKSLSCPLQYLSSAFFSVATVLDSTEHVSLLGLGSLRLGNYLSQISLWTTKKSYQIFSKSACQWGFWLMTLLVTGFPPSNYFQVWIWACAFSRRHGKKKKKATCKSINPTFVSPCRSFCFQAITLKRKKKDLKYFTVIERIWASWLNRLGFDLCFWHLLDERLWITLPIFWCSVFGLQGRIFQLRAYICGTLMGMVYEPWLEHSEALVKGSSSFFCCILA